MPSLPATLMLAAAITAGTAPAAAAPRAARAAAAAPIPTPKLLVAISVDQFSGDVFAEYRGLVGAGLKRLSEGAVFPAGYQSHAATETCPGHSTILTGSRPARTGIIANNWFDLSLPRDDKRLYCAEDTDAPGSSADHYEPSVKLLKVPTLGDRMKRADPANRSFAVAGKDRAAIMMGGHETDQMWFWGGRGFVTLKGHPGPVPAAIAAANARVATTIAAADTPPVPAACAAKAIGVPVGPRSMGEGIVRKAGDAGAFRATPAFDGAVADLAIALLDEQKLGRGAGTDVLAISLSATDYVGHAFGTEGAEMCTQVLALDHTIGRILTALDRSGVAYAVTLTADHGGHDLPERNAAHGFADEVRATGGATPDAVGAALAADFGLKGTILHGDGRFGDMYLDRSIPAALRPRVLAAAKARFLADPQVATVFTGEELRRVIPSGLPIDEWPLAERFAASYDPERSGDLVVALRPRLMPTPVTSPAVATHGSPWNYDRRVPILFWWPGMRGFEQPNPVETVDILPTLAALVRLPVPAAEIDGRCLDLDPGPGTTCPAK
ncbi:MAG: alkaline phosphatase family protein [Sphingomonas fennica]